MAHKAKAHGSWPLTGSLWSRLGVQAASSLTKALQGVPKVLRSPGWQLGRNETGAWPYRSRPLRPLPIRRSVLGFSPVQGAVPAVLQGRGWARAAGREGQPQGPDREVRLRGPSPSRVARHKGRGPSQPGRPAPQSTVGTGDPAPGPRPGQQSRPGSGRSRPRPGSPHPPSRPRPGPASPPRT